MRPLRLVSHASLAEPERDRRLFEYMVLAGYGLIAQMATSLYFRVELQYAPARLYDLATFTAHRPYQYRVLVPAIVHFLALALHASRYQYLPLYQFIECAATFGALVAFRALLSMFISPARASLCAGFLIVPMLMIHVSCAENGFPSDTPSIMLAICGLIALRRERWLWFYTLLAIATVNRESSALLVASFGLVMLGRMPFRRLAIHFAAMCSLWCAIKLAIDRIFAHNPGNLTENHIGYNRVLLHELLHGQPYVLSTVLLLCIIPVCLYVGRRHVPEFLRRLLYLVPMFSLVMWQVGIFDEVRAWNEIIIIVAAPLLVLLSELADRAASAEQDNLTADTAADESRAPTAQTLRAV